MALGAFMLGSFSTYVEGPRFRRVLKELAGHLRASRLNKNEAIMWHHLATMAEKVSSDGSANSVSYKDAARKLMVGASFQQCYKGAARKVAASLQRRHKYLTNKSETTAEPQADGQVQTNPTETGYQSPNNGTATGTETNMVEPQPGRNRPINN